MQNPHDQNQHDGPPDQPGWWLIQVPGVSKPYLVHVTEDDPPSVVSMWQEGFACWHLPDLVETQNIEAVLDRLLGRPKVLWEMAQALSYMLLAGPWMRDDANGFWARWGPTSGPLAYLSEDSDGFTASVGDARRTKPTLEEAKAAADRLLTRRGYYLIDG